MRDWTNRIWQTFPIWFHSSSTFCVCLFDNEMKVREKEIDRVRIEQQEKRTACSFDLLNNQLENTCINLIFYLKMICLVFLIIIWWRECLRDILFKLFLLSLSLYQFFYSSDWLDWESKMKHWCACHVKLESLEKVRWTRITMTVRLLMNVLMG